MSYFKNCPNFHKESLRHTEYYTVKRTVTAERNWFNPSRQLKTMSTSVQLATVSAWSRWSQLYFYDAGCSHFKGKSVYSPSKSNGVAFSCIGAFCTACRKFFQGELWVHIELTSVVPSLKEQIKNSGRRGLCYSSAKTSAGRFVHRHVSAVAGEGQAGRRGGGKLCCPARFPTSEVFIF